MTELEKVLAEALRWLVDHSVPTHGDWCFLLEPDEACVCGVSDRYEAILALAIRAPIPGATGKVERLDEAITRGMTPDARAKYLSARDEMTAALRDTAPAIDAKPEPLPRNIPGWQGSQGGTGSDRHHD